MVERLEREVKVETLRRIVVACQDEASSAALKNQLIMYAAKEWGTERRKTLEYLNQLIAEESIFIEGENVWTLARWLRIEKARKLDYLNCEDVIKGFMQTKLT